MSLFKRYKFKNYQEIHIQKRILYYKSTISFVKIAIICKKLTAGFQSFHAMICQIKQKSCISQHLTPLNNIKLYFSNICVLKSTQTIFGDLNLIEQPKHILKLYLKRT